MQGGAGEPEKSGKSHRAATPVTLLIFQSYTLECYPTARHSALIRSVEKQTHLEPVRVI